MTYKRIVIIPYKLASASAKALKQGLLGLDIPVILVSHLSKKYQPRYTDYIINWGCSKQWEFITYENQIPNQVCVDKLETFTAITAWNSYADDLPNINIPNWTTDKNVAATWKGTVVCRTMLNGHSGAGIVLVDTPNVLPDAPLYVEYKKKKHEYRVHIFNGTVIDITQKKKRKGAEFVDTKIRNHKNGWIYAREGITVPDGLVQQAVMAMQAVDLTFGAVDLIWNEKENKCYVLEINTAPGLVGTTLDKYVEAFTKEILDV